MADNLRNPQQFLQRMSARLHLFSFLHGGGSGGDCQKENMM